VRMKDTVTATVELEVEADWSAVYVGVIPLTLETLTPPARTTASALPITARRGRAVTDCRPPGRAP
jgi:hypothetical protein